MIQNTNDFQGALESPRYDDDTDVLYWYEGDAFYIDWTIDLSDNNVGGAYEYKDGDAIVFSFYNIKKQLVHEFVFNHIPDSHIVRLEFTEHVSDKFRAGNYTYCAKYYWTEDDGFRRVQTIINQGVVKVEHCH